MNKRTLPITDETERNRAMKTVYHHAFWEAEKGTMSIIREYRDKGWELISHTIYYTPDKVKMFSCMFKRECYGTLCYDCPYKVNLPD